MARSEGADPTWTVQSLRTIHETNSKRGVPVKTRGTGSKATGYVDLAVQFRSIREGILPICVARSVAPVVFARHAIDRRRALGRRDILHPCATASFEGCVEPRDDRRCTHVTRDESKTVV